MVPVIRPVELAQTIIVRVRKIRLKIIAVIDVVLRMVHLLRFGLWYNAVLRGLQTMDGFLPRFVQGKQKNTGLITVKAVNPLWDNGRKRLYQTPRSSSGLSLEVTNDHSAGRLHAESSVERSQVVVAHEIDHVIALQLINHSPDQFSSDLVVLEIRQDFKQWYVGR